MHTPNPACYAAIFLGSILGCSLLQAQPQGNDEVASIQVLESAAPLADKDAACARLRQIGTEKSVPYLAKLLPHPELSHSARFALTTMPYPSATEALLTAAQATTGTTKAGILISLGERRATNAATFMGQCLADPDGTVAIAAARALGRVGSLEAMEALSAFLDQSGGGLRLAVLDSILAAADQQLKAGQPAAVLRLYRRLTGPDFPGEIQMAAHRGIMLSDLQKAPDLILEALGGEAGPAQNAALSLMPDLQTDDFVPKLCGALPGFQTEVQAAVLQALVYRRDRRAGGSVLALTKSKEPKIRLQALTALGTLGDAAAVPALLAAATQGDAAESSAAKASLSILHADGVEQALRTELQTGAGAHKAQAASTLAGRGDRSALPALLWLAATDDLASKAAMEALALLAEPADLPALARLVCEADDFDRASERSSVLQKAIIRWQSAHERIDGAHLAQAIETSTPVARRALLQASGALPDPQVRSALRKGLEDPAPEIRLAAIRGLCETTDAELLPDLITVATMPGREDLRLQATRAITRLVTEDAAANATADWKLAGLAKLMAARDLRVDQARIVLGALGSIPGVKSLEIAEASLPTRGLENEAAQTILKLAPSVSETLVATRAVRAISGSTASPEIKAASAEALKELLGRSAFLKNWELAGPYSQPGKSFSDLFSIPFPPELGTGGIQWKKPSSAPHQNAAQIIDLLREWPGEQCVAYARTTFNSPKAQQAVLVIGSDDGIKVWLNGALVHSHNVARPIQPGSDKVQIQLLEGTNSVLVKLTQNNAGWAFCAQLLAADGAPVENLELP